MILLSFAAATGAFAGESTIDTRIHGLIAPTRVDEATRVMSTSDGNVYEVDETKRGLLVALMSAQGKKAPVTLTLDDQDRVVRVRELSPPQAAAYRDALTGAQNVPGGETGDAAVADATVVAQPNMIQDGQGLGYYSTNLKSMSDANELFSAQTMLNFNSECYQRAEHWTHELNITRGIKSMKVFLFFTQSFIRAHKYRWWFHVAPFVYVNGTQVVLDHDFGITEPKQMQPWTDFFMMDDAFVHNGTPYHPVCTEVAKYSDYDQHQNQQDCFTIKVPMYYYQPQDVQDLEEKGLRLNDFRSGDLEHAEKCFKHFWKC